MRRWPPLVVPAAAVLCMCLWGQAAPAGQESSSTPSAPQPQDKPTDNRKEGWFHKRVSTGCVAGTFCWGDDQDKKTQSARQAQQTPPPNQPPPRSDAPPRSPNDSSSRDTQSDLGPPVENSPRRAESDVMEMAPWDPHRAAKDVEVGDFYFKRQNYRAAISRYCEALAYKPNDAMATIRLAESLEKAGDLAGAMTYYQGYLKVLPQGPLAERAKNSLEEIQAKAEQPSKGLAQRLGCGRAVKTAGAEDQDRPTLRRKSDQPKAPGPTSRPAENPR